MEAKGTKLIDKLKPTLENLKGLSVNQITYFENKAETIKVMCEPDQQFPFVFIWHDFKTGDLQADFREKQFVGVTYSFSPDDEKQVDGLKVAIADFLKK